MKIWWEKYPDFYEREIEALRASGYIFSKDEKSFERGKLVLKLAYPYRGEEIDLIISYPDTFPFLRPHVSAPNLELPYHQNPIDKELCLLGQRSDAWDVEETAIGLIESQLPQTIATARDDDKENVKGLEVHQAEPISDYLQYKPNSVLLVDSAWEIPISTIGGLLRIAPEPGHQQVNKSIGETFRGAVLEVQDSGGKVISKMSSQVNELFANKFAPITGRWVRLEKTPEVIDAQGFARLLENHRSAEAKFVLKRLREGGNGIVGFLFPEESVWRGGNGDGWVFLTYYSQKKGKPPKIYLTKADRVGGNDSFLRIPELSSLRTKTIAVLGLGCVGAPSAIEFAKCGIQELRLLDCDVHTVGNSCRWPLGLPFSGRHKVEAIANFINPQYPYTRIGKSLGYRVGSPTIDEIKEINEFLDGVDIIYDATAELGVQHLFATLASERRIPFVLIESRPGGWGGIVARITPEAEGCFYCFRHHLTEGTIITPPQASEKQDVQPLGCISPTFTAASFDTSTISLSGVRLAVATLCRSTEDAYPDLDFDIGVLSVRNPEAKKTTFPSWQTYQLIKHPKCDHCQG